MKILIIGGIHGNEQLGIDLANKIQSLNNPNLQSILGNPRAIEKNVRFLEKDLNRVFGSRSLNCYEEVRANEILDFVSQNNFDLILDFHNTKSLDNDCTFVGSKCNDKLFQISTFLDLSRVIIADYKCINECMSNCISVEISENSTLNNVGYWLDKCLELLNTKIEELPISRVEKYKFGDKVITKNLATFLQGKTLISFEAISETEKKYFDFDAYQNYYPVFVEEPAYGQDFYCRLVTKLITK